jgi:hypothetical protein
MASSGGMHAAITVAKEGFNLWGGGNPVCSLKLWNIKQRMKSRDRKVRDQNECVLATTIAKVGIHLIQFLRIWSIR